MDFRVTSEWEEKVALACSGFPRHMPPEAQQFVDDARAQLLSALAGWSEEVKTPLPEPVTRGFTVFVGNLAPGTSAPPRVYSDLAQDPAYAYVALLEPSRVAAVAASLGPSPSLERLYSLPASDYSSEVLAGSGPGVAEADFGHDRKLDLTGRSGTMFLDVVGFALQRYYYGVHSSWHPVVSARVLPSVRFRRNDRFTGLVAPVEALRSEQGFCYLRLFEPEDAPRACFSLGKYPSLQSLAAFHREGPDLWLELSVEGVWHVRESFSPGCELWSVVKARCLRGEGLAVCDMSTSEVSRVTVGAEMGAELTVFVPAAAELLDYRSLHVRVAELAEAIIDLSESLTFEGEGPLLDPVLTAEGARREGSCSLVLDCSALASAAARLWVRHVSTRLLPAVVGPDQAIEVSYDHGQVIWRCDPGIADERVHALVLAAGFRLAEVCPDVWVYRICEGLVPPEVLLGRACCPTCSTGEVMDYERYVHVLSGVHRTRRVRCDDTVTASAGPPLLSRGVGLDFGSQVGENCYHVGEFWWVLMPPGVELFVSGGWQQLQSAEWICVEGDRLRVKAAKPLGALLAIREGSGFDPGIWWKERIFETGMPVSGFVEKTVTGSAALCDKVACRLWLEGQLSG